MTLYKGKDKSIKIETIEDDVSVTLRQDSIIVEVLFSFVDKFKDMFWLQTCWIEKDDMDKHKDSKGVINEINLIPSRPNNLVVKILYNSPKIFIITEIMSTIDKLL